MSFKTQPVVFHYPFMHVIERSVFSLFTKISFGYVNDLNPSPYCYLSYCTLSLCLVCMSSITLLWDSPTKTKLLYFVAIISKVLWFCPHIIRAVVAGVTFRSEDGRNCWNGMVFTCLIQFQPNGYDSSSVHQPLLISTFFFLVLILSEWYSDLQWCSGG